MNFGAFVLVLLMEMIYNDLRFLSCVELISELVYRSLICRLQSEYGFFDCHGHRFVNQKKPISWTERGKVTYDNIIISMDR